MHKLPRIAFLAFSLLLAMAAHAAAPALTSLSLVTGSAGGGTTLHIYGTDFGTPGVSVVNVLVGGEYCQNTLLVEAGDIQCQMPVGVPGSSVGVTVYVDGVISSNTLPFDYLPRPWLQDITVVTGYDNYGTPILYPYGAMGSAGGGDTLLIGSFNFGFLNYAPWEGQPRDLKVFVGGNECLNPVLHWNDVLAGVFGMGNTISCTTPAGMPGSNSNEIRLFIDGVQDQQSASCNGCGYPFDYFPRPQLQDITVVTGYDNYGTPLFSGWASGSAGGGDTLVLQSSNSGFGDYALWEGQPRDLKVYVGGNECLNPVLHWNDIFGQGTIITCTTPAGIPGDVDAEIKLFINGVQDQQSAQCNGCGYPFDYWQRPRINGVDMVGHDVFGAPMLQPAFGSAAGGDTLVIRGYNNSFLEYVHWIVDTQPRSLAVTVGGKECSNATLDGSGDYGYPGEVITCITPAGMPGDMADIKLLINGVQDEDSFNLNAMQFTYWQRPRVTDVEMVGHDVFGAPMLQPAFGSAAGGDTLVIRGYNNSFLEYVHWIVDTQPRSLAVTVGGKECSNATLDGSGDYGYPGEVITCITPAGMPGDMADIKLLINGVQDEDSFNLNAMQFTYWQRPTISTVERLVLDPDTGAEIHDALLEGSPAGGTRLQIMLSHQFHPGVTPNWQVMIGAAPCANVQYDEANQSISCFTPSGSAGSLVPIRVWQDGMPAIENDPAVFSFQYRGLPQISQLTPANGFSGGGSVLSIQGNFFADVFSQITVRVGNKLCDNAQLINPTTIECTVPRGVANTTVPVTVSVDGANTPTPNALPFTYDAAPQLTSLTPDRGPLSGGNLLEIEGANFGNFVDGMPLSIPMVLVGNKLCSNPVFTDETHLVCIVPSSTTATTVNVSVFVDGIAAGNKLPYTYAAPAFSNITPAEGLPAGGYPVVISGSDLGVPGQTSVAVKVGTKYCSSPVLVADSEIHCTMPAGTGSNLPVTVYLNGQAKVTGLTFSYVIPVPVLQSVTPAQGLASGGTLITLSGSHFGISGASVLVGNSVCTVQSQTEEEIVCSTTAGNAGMQPLTVTVGGNISNALLFEYTGPMPLNGIFRGSSVQENTGVQ